MSFAQAQIFGSLARLLDVVQLRRYHVHDKRATGGRLALAVRTRCRSRRQKRPGVQAARLFEHSIHRLVSIKVSHAASGQAYQLTEQARGKGLDELTPRIEYAQVIGSKRSHERERM